MSTKTIRHTAILALLAMTGSTYAVDQFRSVASGSWNNNTTWEIFKGGGWVAAGAGVSPVAGDIVTIQSTGTPVTVDSSAACAQLTINSSSTLNVGGASAGTLVMSGNSTFSGTLSIAANGIFDVSGAVLTVASGANVTIASGGLLQTSNSAPAVIVIGTLTDNGTFKLDATSGTPYLRVEATQDIPASSTGRIQGVLHSTGNRPEIRLHSGVTMTANNGTLDGDLKIMGTANGNGTFANSGAVDANIAAEIEIASTLAGFSDDSSAVWKANANGGSIYFDEPASGLTGSFQLLVTGCKLKFNQNVSTPSMVVDHGRIEVTGGTFTVGTVTGACAGKPA